MRSAILSTGCALLLTSCAPAAQFDDRGPQFFEANAYPERLSAWNLLRRDASSLQLNPAAQTYDVNMPLFSDYAAKHRSVWLPPDTRAAQRADGRLVFPVGTIVSKTFLYPGGHAGEESLQRLQQATIDTRQAQLIETRLMIKQTSGWDAVSYVWQGDEAFLKRTGAVVPVRTAANSDTTFSYVVPSANECASCHATDHSTGALQPIGLQLAQLQSSVPGTNESAQRLLERDWLTELAPTPDIYPTWENRSDGDRHARAYLDSNCAHCHSLTGPAKTSGLNLVRSNTAEHAMGICKPPIAAGKGSGGRLYSIVPGAPEESILAYRLESTDPSRRMPEIGRSLTHAAGLQVINQWIASLAGQCR